VRQSHSSLINHFALTGPICRLGTNHGRRWGFIFIDGDHWGDGPLNDAVVCEQYAAEDAMILFHDLAFPDVAAGLNYLAQQGWKTAIYHTQQIMGVAWRGRVKPIRHNVRLLYDRTERFPTENSQVLAARSVVRLECTRACSWYSNYKRKGLVNSLM
jgi:hypothetical protein